MTPVAYYAPGEETSPMWAFAFAKGCSGYQMPHDFQLDPPEPLFDGPVAAFGSPPLWPLLRQTWAEGRDWYYGDHAYFGRRVFYRITRNAFQHDGRGASTGSRFKGFSRDIDPWHKTGHHVLICPQSATYCALHGFDVRQWLKTVVATLRRYTERPIRIRWKRQGTPIASDLWNCWAVVVHSSAAALDALIAGVPIFVLAPFAASARMGLADLSQIESPYYPEDREPFLWALADHQWTLREILDGLAWRTLQEGATRAAA
jgi:hypothetical protein